jgi:hypothetical protein
VDAAPLTGDSSARRGAERREFIAFVRTHHPDVGGDPEEFRRGLAAFETARAGRPGTAGAVEVHRRRRGPGVFLDRLADARRRRRRPPRVV